VSSFVGKIISEFNVRCKPCERSKSTKGARAFRRGKLSVSVACRALLEKRVKSSLNSIDKSFGKMATRKAWHKGKLGWIEIEDW